MQNHVALRKEKQSITGFAWSLLAVNSTAGALLLRMVCTENKPGVCYYSMWHMAKNGVLLFLKVDMSNLSDGLVGGEF